MKEKAWIYFILFPPIGYGWELSKTIYQAASDVNQGEEKIYKEVYEEIAQKKNRGYFDYFPSDGAMSVSSLFFEILKGDPYIKSADDLTRDPCPICLPGLYRWELIGYCYQYIKDGNINKPVTVITVETNYAHLAAYWLSLMGIERDEYFTIHRPLPNRPTKQG